VRLRQAGTIAAIVATLMMAENAAIYATQVLPHVRTFSPALERSLVTWGRWFDRHADRDAVIATPDIGAIGYYSQRRVVDLAGLVTPAMVPLLERESEEQATANFDSRASSRPTIHDRAPRRELKETSGCERASVARRGAGSEPAEPAGAGRLHLHRVN
jgi:hypothetical protein